MLKQHHTTKYATTFLLFPTTNFSHDQKLHASYTFDKNEQDYILLDGASDHSIQNGAQNKKKSV